MPVKETRPGYAGLVIVDGGDASGRVKLGNGQAWDVLDSTELRSLRSRRDLGLNVLRCAHAGGIWSNPKGEGRRGRGRDAPCGGKRGEREKSLAERNQEHCADMRSMRKALTSLKAQDWTEGKFCISLIRDSG